MGEEPLLLLWPRMMTPLVFADNGWGRTCGKGGDGGKTCGKGGLISKMHMCMSTAFRHKASCIGACQLKGHAHHMRMQT